jgi:hypothetical protein
MKRVIGPFKINVSTIPTVLTEPFKNNVVCGVPMVIFCL